MTMGLQYLLRAVLDLLVATPARLLQIQGSSQFALVRISAARRAESVYALSIGLNGAKLDETISVVSDAGQTLPGTVKHRSTFEMK